MKAKISRQRIWALKNLDKVNKYRREWQRKNRDKVNKWKRKYRAKMKG